MELAERVSLFFCTGIEMVEDRAGGDSADYDSYIPLPKSVTPHRIKSNSELYDFELDQDDMTALDGLDEGAKGASTWNPVDAD
jgi:hypothetical protein